MTPPSHIGLFFLGHNKRAFRVAGQVVRAFEKRGLQVSLEEDAARALRRRRFGNAETMSLDQLVRSVDMLASVGGDGTLLHVARSAAPARCPVLGINKGHLGFLSSLSPDALEDGLDRLLLGDYLIERRMMLDVRVMRRKRTVSRHIVLNDCVVKREVSRILCYDLHLGGQFIDAFPADGLIVSTPTGSTAYSLSAGGPICSPSLDVILLCPICPHRFYARSLVVPASETVEVSFDHVADSEEDMEISPSEAVRLTVDGQSGGPLQPGDRLRVRRSRHRAHLVRFTGSSFLQVLRQKLG